VPARLEGGDSNPQMCLESPLAGMHECFGTDGISFAHHDAASDLILPWPLSRVAREYIAGMNCGPIVTWGKTASHSACHRCWLVEKGIGSDDACPQHSGHDQALSNSFLCYNQCRSRQTSGESLPGMAKGTDVRMKEDPSRDVSGPAATVVSFQQMHFLAKPGLLRHLHASDGLVGGGSTLCRNLVQAVHVC